MKILVHCVLPLSCRKLTSAEDIERLAVSEIGRCEQCAAGADLERSAGVNHKHARFAENNILLDRRESTLYRRRGMAVNVFSATLEAGLR
jgi:hypothetical protein